MTIYDPTVNERMKKFAKMQMERGQKQVHVWVDSTEFERGYALYNRESQTALLEELKTSLDPAALILGWRKAMYQRPGTAPITQGKIDHRLNEIKKMGSDLVQIAVDPEGNVSVQGPATAKQLSALARLSERVRKNGQAKN